MFKYKNEVDGLLMRFENNHDDDDRDGNWIVQFGISLNECEHLQNVLIQAIEERQALARSGSDYHIKCIKNQGLLMDLKNELQELQDKMDVNHRKMKHLKMIHGHLNRDVNHLLDDLEHLASSCISSPNSSMIEFDQLFASLEFRLQFTSQLSDPDVKERVRRLQVIDSELAKQFKNRKDLKLERYYQYIGDTLKNCNKDCNVDDVLFEHIKRLINELSVRNDLHQNKVDQCTSEQVRTQLELSQDKQFEQDIIDEIVKSEQKYKMHFQDVVKATEKRDQMFDIIMSQRPGRNKESDLNEQEKASIDEIVRSELKEARIRVSSYEQRCISVQDELEHIKSELYQAQSLLGQLLEQQENH
ncbi:histone H2B [Acrasis kona]|uniref:Histone H2B n=1 Tax=Acrasis kona TaxID=1008807 RepID=A0AAW2Z8J9_9EUKA